MTPLSHVNFNAGPCSVGHSHCRHLMNVKTGGGGGGGAAGRIAVQHTNIHHHRWDSDGTKGAHVKGPHVPWTGSTQGSQQALQKPTRTTPGCKRKHRHCTVPTTAAQQQIYWNNHQSRRWGTKTLAGEHTRPSRTARVLLKHLGPCTRHSNSQGHEEARGGRGHGVDVWNSCLRLQASFHGTLHPGCRCVHCGPAGYGWIGLGRGPHTTHGLEQASGQLGCSCGAMRGKAPFVFSYSGVSSVFGAPPPPPPPRTFGSWDYWHCAVNATVLTDAAKAFVTYGLAKAGCVPPGVRMLSVCCGECGCKLPHSSRTGAHPPPTTRASHARAHMQPACLWVVG
jgi:hypothetical protein